DLLRPRQARYRAALHPDSQCGILPENTRPSVGAGAIPIESGLSPGRTAMHKPNWRTPAMVLFCGGMILTVALGVRHNFGLYLQPMTADLGIGRETFAFAIAIQNLLYGISQPITGLIADKFGTARVLV